MSSDGVTISVGTFPNTLHSETHFALYDSLC
jgi:hypothetical protein